ncbi:MAG: MBOAT family protein [Oscillospiraceae bacterium]|nr:MBOAT family protein [Oscillospiraceae bacterium]
MVFSSLLFLYVFFPLCLLAYFLVPSIKGKNAVLIAASLVFYAWGEPLYVFLLVAVAAVNYGFGRWMEYNREAKKTLLIVAVSLNIACLAVFKYAGLFVQTVSDLFSLGWSAPAIALPIGISFYIFQSISYLADVYRDDVPAQKSFWRFLLYISLFPQLIAGPIVRYREIESQLEKRELQPRRIFYGALRFCIGLGKKVLIANYAGKVVAMLLTPNATVTGAWFGMVMFAFEIYFDFSGYSDMAIGMGHIFGFQYAENFDLPYTAGSITEFWRRWHISLGSFFRDYVYIPMGGNRRHQILNLLVVWSLTGIWHGASWNFLLWGLYFFVLLVAEKKLQKMLARIPKWLCHIGTLFLLLIGWTVFYYTDFPQMLSAFKTMFGGAAAYTQETGAVMLNSLPLLLVCILGSTRLPRMAGLLLNGVAAAEGASNVRWREVVYAVSVTVFDLAILALSTVSLVGSTYNPFLYFRF